jgi:hypothetical protein
VFAPQVATTGKGMAAATTTTTALSQLTASRQRKLAMSVLRAPIEPIGKAKYSGWRTAVRPATQLPLKDEDELEDELAENSSGSSAAEVQKMPILSVFSAGGAEGGSNP